MSQPGSVGPEKTVPAKKPISPARRIVSLILLAGVIGFGCVEVIPKWGYNAAVAKLEARTAEENKDLMTMQEAEALMGKAADGPAVDFRQNNFDFSKKTYTWNGLVWHYTVTAFYTKEKTTPHLHHYATEGKENEIELPKLQSAAAPEPKSKGGGVGSPTKSTRGTQGGTGTSSPSPPKAAPDTKSPPSAPGDKPAETKPEPSEKAATPKPNPPGDGAPKEKPASPAGDGSPTKPAADAPATKPLQ
jgi:hypothetical protein